MSKEGRKEERKKGRKKTRKKEKKEGRKETKKSNPKSERFFLTPKTGRRLEYRICLQIIKEITKQLERK
jgi:hypothetical protein